jgi:hypothetical protein
MSRWARRLGGAYCVSDSDQFLIDRTRSIAVTVTALPASSCLLWPFPFDPFIPFFSVSPFVNASFRAPLDPNGNVRSGWQ